jgi:hypothetical protein
MEIPDFPVVSRSQGMLSANIGRGVRLASVGLALSASTGAADAQVVNFQGIIVPVCVLVPTAGVLAINAAGNQIGSEESGGAAAALAVTSTGGAPTISFTAPTLAAKPAGYGGTPTLSLKYSSGGGAAQAYTSASSQYTSTNPLSDTVTLHAKAADSNGFVAGTYRIATTATCSQ